MKYTKIPTTAFDDIQLNAGILLEKFDIETGEFEMAKILGATSGGLSFSESLEFLDFGEDIDNCPKNTKELKQIDERTVACSGTFVTISPEKFAKVMPSAEMVDLSYAIKITPHRDLSLEDFSDLWLVCDYSSKNTGEHAGYIAIHMMDVLNTGGFSLTTADKAKGQFAFEYTAHYSIERQDVVPYELYVRKGTEVVEPSIRLNKKSLTMKVGDTATLTASVVPAGTTVQWGNPENVVTCENGLVTAIGTGNVQVSATIVVDGVSYTDLCTVVVTE